MGKVTRSGVNIKSVLLASIVQQFQTVGTPFLHTDRLCIRLKKRCVVSQPDLFLTRVVNGIVIVFHGQFAFNFRESLEKAWTVMFPHFFSIDFTAQFPPTNSDQPCKIVPSLCASFWQLNHDVFNKLP